MKRAKPLHGNWVVVTRPPYQAQRLIQQLRRLGARVIAAPAIRIDGPRSWTACDRALEQLDRNDAVIFTSANAVESFFSRARKVLGEDPVSPPRTFAIGPQTAKALRSQGWRGAVIADHFVGEALARRIHPARGWRILLPRARQAREALPSALRRRGAIVEIVEVYRTMGHRAGLARIRRAVDEGRARYVTFTSSSTVEQVVRALGSAKARRFFREATAASIGPVTSATLRKFGIRNIIEAKPYTAQGIVRAILKHHSARPIAPDRRMDAGKGKRHDRH